MSSTARNFTEKELQDLHKEHLEYFLQHQNTSLPYAIEELGEKEGSHFVIGGGIHGNELSGVYAAVKIHRQLASGKLKLKKGKLTFILGNPAAYAKVTRMLDANLNRILSKDDLPNNIEGRRAKEIQDFIELHHQSIDILVDFHSVSIGDFTMGIYNRADAAYWKVLSELPRVFNYYFGYLNEHIDGTFTHLANKFGIPSFSAECGNHVSTLAEDRVLYFIIKTCELYGIEFEGEWPKYERDAIEEVVNPIHYHTIAQIPVVPEMKFIVDELKTGKELKQNEIYAIGTGPAGAQIELRAPDDCELVMPSAHINPNDTDAGFLCIRAE